MKRRHSAAIPVRSFAALVLAALVLASCSWGQPAFDAGRSNSNPLESSLTTANVASLERHVIPGSASVPPPTVLTITDLVLVSGASGVDAYPVASCPHADGSPCIARWHRAGRMLTTFDSSVLVTTGTTTFDALDTTGAVVRHYDTQAAAGFVLSRAAVTSGWILADLGKSGAVPDDPGTEVVVAFPRGCTDTTCTPSGSLPIARKICCGYDWAAVGSTLYSSDRGPLTARDIPSGTRRWTADRDTLPGLITYRVRDGRVLGSDGAVYDAAGVQGCAGTPTVCSPLRTLTGYTSFGTETSDSVSATRAVAGYVPQGAPTQTALGSWPTDGSTCSDSPAVCAPIAVTDRVVVPAVTTQRLTLGVSSVEFFGPHRHLVAYDVDNLTGCSGAPQVCTPVADIDLVTTSVPGAVVVAGGRVYVPFANGTVEVLSLPGDVK